MGGKKTEACGRCSVTTVMDAVESVDDGREVAESRGTNPFDGDRIELDEDEVTAVVRHEVFAARVKDRLDRIATKLIYG